MPEVAFYYCVWNRFTIHGMERDNHTVPSLRKDGSPAFLHNLWKIAPKGLPWHLTNHFRVVLWHGLRLFVDTVAYYLVFSSKDVTGKKSVYDGAYHGNQESIWLHENVQ